MVLADFFSIPTVRLFLLVIISTIFAFWMPVRKKYQEKKLGLKSGLLLKKSYYVLPFFLILLVLILFAGLRTRYNDTATYIQQYEDLSIEEGFFSGVDWSLGSNPGFMLLNRILKLFGFSSQTFLLLCSSFILFVYIWFVYKYSRNFPLSVFIVLTSGPYLFSMAAIKQCIAIAIGMIAVDQAIQKHWGKFYLLLAVGMTFHIYVIMFLIVPLLTFRPYSNKTYLTILIAAVFTLTFGTSFSVILHITSALGEDYHPSSFIGEGVSLFRLAVSWAPVLLGFFCRKLLKKKQDPVQYMMMNATFLYAELMLISRLGTAFYFTRVANYFSLFPAVSIPWILQFFDSESQKFLKIVIYVGFFGFLFYQCVINKSFANIYSSISLFSYLKMIFT